MVKTLACFLVLLAATSGTAAGAPAADPYHAGLAYAACMRAHGVPHPDPDRNGDFTLTRTDDARLRAAGRAKVEAADAACFHFLKPFVSTKPLSPRAIARAKAVLAQVRSCMADAGFRLGPPRVRNLTRGRAFFGFANDATSSKPSPAMSNADRACEKKVGLATKIDAIVAVLVLAPVAHTAGQAPQRTVPCREVIDHPRFPYSNSGYRTVLGAVSVPPAYMALIENTG
jgi:hypothetical protein